MTLKSSTNSIQFSAYKTNLLMQTPFGAKEAHFPCMSKRFIPKLFSSQPESQKQYLRCQPNDQDHNTNTKIQGRKKKAIKPTN